MPLELATLKAALPGAGGKPYPATSAEAAKQWAQAMKEYAGGITPPSTTLDAATAALEAALVTAFASKAAAPLMETAFLQFVTTLGGGMAGFVAVPPAAPVGFAALFFMPPAASLDEGITRVATKIDTWMRTGTAAIATPPGAPVLWL